MEIFLKHNLWKRVMVRLQGWLLAAFACLQQLYNNGGKEVISEGKGSVVVGSVHQAHH